MLTTDGSGGGTHQNGIIADSCPRLKGYNTNQSRTPKFTHRRESESTPSARGKFPSIYPRCCARTEQTSSYVDTPLLGDAIKSGMLQPELDKTPMGRACTTEEIADSILFLASPMSSYMCGAAMVVDGGYTL